MDTETLRNVANYVLWLGLFMAASGTFGVNHFRAKLEGEREVVSKRKEQDAGARATALQDNVNELIAGKNELVQQNRRLLTDLQQYQKALGEREAELQALKQSALAAKRGVVKRFDFNGARRIQSGGNVQVMLGDEVAVFERIQALEGQQAHNEIIALCTAQIVKTPEWLTPYLARAAAYINLRQKALAISDVMHVIEGAAGDPDYKRANDLLVAARALQ